MARSPFLTFQPRTVAKSLVIALIAVPVIGLLSKGLIEGSSSATYTIHWFETVPLLVLFTAFVVNGMLNDRRTEGQGG